MSDEQMAEARRVGLSAALRYWRRVAERAEGRMRAVARERAARLEDELLAL